MDTIIQEPLDDSQAPITLIWLHGLGVGGSDFESFQKELSQFGGLDNVRMVLPTAPSRDISAYKLTMNAWYDLYTENFEEQEAEDIEGMNQSASVVTALIEELRQKYPTSPIWLGGFSQGAALALIAGLSQIPPVAGIIALSGYVPRHPRFEELSDVAKQPPIFMAHGTLDSVITIAQARAGLETLNQAGATVEFFDYPMMHEICPDEVTDIAEFIKAHSKSEDDAQS